MAEYVSPLNKLLELEKEARAFGFNWPDQEAILKQISSECAEVKEAIEKLESSERIQEEIGDLLHGVIALCTFSGFEVEQTISMIHAKFAGRMSALKEITKEHGLENLQNQSYDFMLQLWEKAKK